MRAKMIFKEPMLDAYMLDNAYTPWLFALVATYLQWIIKIGWPFGVYAKVLKTTQSQ